MKLSGKVALVTGGSRGIGRAVALELAAQGGRVAINYAGRADAAMETVARLKELGVEAEAFQADVSCPQQCEGLIQAVKERFGRLDLLVNNAGITRDGLMMTAKPEDFAAVLDTNLKGAYFCMKAASRIMLRQKYGRIVNMSSVVGLRGNPGQTAYAASKAGIVGLTKAAAKELASRNITVNAVAPGLIETDMTDAMVPAAREQMAATIPLGRNGRPEDVAEAVCFLLSSDYITGQVLCVDGGMAV